MTRHPLHDAFDRVEHEPTAAFRDRLRAELLDELVAPDAAPDSVGDSAAGGGDRGTVRTDDVPVRSEADHRRRGRPRYRVVLAAAATIVVVGAVVLLVVTGGHDDVTTVTIPETVPSTTTTPTTTTPTTTTPTTTTPTTAPTTVPVDDEALVAEALVESNEIGPGLEIAALKMGTQGRPDNWALFNDAFAAEPVCAERTAIIGPLLADATGAGNVWNAEGASWNLFASSVTAFADVDAASQAMDAYVAPSYPDCFIAVWDTIIEANDGGRNDVASTFLDEAPIDEHGDRQVQFSISTTSTGFAPSPTISRVLYIQYGRLVLSIVVNEDSLGPDAPSGITQVTIRAAVGAIEDALGID
jgi:hypothetical protein